MVHWKTWAGLFAILILSACGKKEPSSGGGSSSSPDKPADKDTGRTDGGELGDPPPWDEAKYPLLPDMDMYKTEDYRDIEQIKDADKVYRLWLTKEFKEFPKVILECKRLQMLWLQAKVGTIPKELFALRNLQRLGLQSGEHPALPREVGWLTNLVELSIGNNKFTVLPKEIGRLKKLKGLSVGSNQLTSLGEGVCELERLEQLDLSSNKIKALPKEIGRLKALKNLNLNGNQLEALPEEILQLENLEDLAVGWNKLEALPEIGRLKKLRAFTFHDNPRLKKLPESFAELNLAYVYMSRCASLDLADTFAKLARHAKLQNLSLENVRNADVSLFATVFGGPPKDAAPLEVPESIGDLKGLRELDLSYNVFTEGGGEKLFAGLAKLQALEELSLDSCYLVKVSAAAENLTALKRLKLGSTPIKDLPAGIAKLGALETLDLRRCQNLASLPPLQGLSKLKNLWLWSTAIESLPSLEGLTSLEEISLYGCKKFTQAPSLDGLVNLKKLDLEGTAVPKEAVEELKKKYPKVSINFK
ncbi:MAG: leucine-rich repeat domain-containing protein [Planctomycetes bacterium]|nr:leucine-rich repeat domain-containing protein [Planctomycetota bacterium]